MTSLVRILYLKMERKGSGIPGRKEAEGSASSTPFFWQGQGKYFNMLFLRRRVPR
jgi:hypothetical protein